MSHIKGFKNISNNNDKIQTNNSTNNEIQTSLEENKITVEIDSNNEIKVIEHNSTQNNAEVNVENSSPENDVLVMAYSNPNPTGQLFGTGHQNIYWGSNLYEQQPPNPTQQQPPSAQRQPPPAEEPTHREIETTSNYALTYNPETRNRFIKRVMSMVFVMLLMTAAFIAVVLAVPDVKNVFDNHRMIILIPSIMLIMLVNYAMTFLSPCTRSPPCNIFFLFLSVVSMSLLCGVVTSYFKTQIVLYAFMTTTAVVFMCILLACSEFDFTSYLLYVIVIVTTFSVLAIVILTALVMAQVELKPTFLGILIISTLLQVIIFTIHLQTIIGGKRVELREQDYALGAYMLYMSIIDIFMKMVFMIGLTSDM